MDENGQPDFLPRLVDVYLDNAKVPIKELSIAVANNDVKQIGAITHSLKSASANLGAMRLAELCKAFEACAKNHNRNDAVELCGQVENQFMQVRSILLGKFRRIA